MFFSEGEEFLRRWPKSNWPQSKLAEVAEVEINWPKSNRWCLLCFFFLSFLFFLLLYFPFSSFFCSYSSLASFCFCIVVFFQSFFFDVDLLSVSQNPLTLTHHVRTSRRQPKHG